MESHTEDLLELLADRIVEAIKHREIQICSWDGFSKEAVLHFESFNAGLKNASEIAALIIYDTLRAERDKAISPLTKNLPQ